MKPGGWLNLWFSQKRLDLPADKIPSLSNYLRQHSLKQVAIRFLEGFYEHAVNFLHLIASPTLFYVTSWCYASWWPWISRTLSNLSGSTHTRFFLLSCISLSFLRLLLGGRPSLLAPVSFRTVSTDVVQYPLAIQGLIKQKPLVEDSGLNIKTFSLAAHIMMIVILSVNIYFSLDVAILANSSVLKSIALLHHLLRPLNNVMG